MLRGKVILRCNGSLNTESHNSFHRSIQPVIHTYDLTLLGSLLVTHADLREQV